MTGIKVFAFFGLITIIVALVDVDYYWIELLNAMIMMLCVIGVATLSIKEKAEKRRVINK